MFTRSRPTCRTTAIALPRASLTIVFTLFMLLGSLTSPLLQSVAADTLANDARLDQEQAAQPLQPLGTETATETEVVTEPATETETAVSSETAAASETAVIQNTQALPGEIQVNLYWCPAGTNPDTVPSGDPLKASCIEQGEAVSVSLTSVSDPTLSSTFTVSSFPGSAQFPNLQSDSWMLDIAPTSPVKEGLFCVGNTPYGNTKPYARYAFAQSQQQAYSLDTIAEEKIVCDWFGEVATPGTGTTVTFYKWECPNGTMFGQAQTYYETECATEQAGVPFEVTDTTGMQQTTSDNNGRQLDNLQGQFTLKEKIPVGYGPPAIFCQLLNDAQATDYSSGNGSVTLPANTTDDYQCFFYNIPSDGMSVTIYKWQCPNGTLTGQASSYYSAECATEQAGVPFEVTDTSGTQQTTSDTNGRQIDGLYGEVTIKEMIPTGYSNPAIFCQLLNGQPGQEITGSGDSVTVPPSADDDYQCWFYNIPDMGGGPTNVGNGDVMVYKFECATTPPANSAYAWYFQNCTTPMNGVTFVLDVPDPGFDIQTNTGDSINGAVMMGGVNAGTYPLTETVPATHQIGAVFCATIAKTAIPSPGDFSMQSVNGSSITATVTADMLFYCNWYNVPLDTQGTTVTIYKWECPPGTLYGQTDAYYSAECATEQPGVPFEITDNTGTQQTTSDNNGRQIDDLQGQFTIKEIVPTGFGNPAIFCQLLNDAQSTDYSSTSPSVTLPANNTDDYQCWFYNIPDDGTSVTIYKWECPPGTLYGQTDAYYSAECATEQPGVPFEVTDNSGPQQTTSDNNGRQIDGLYGQITIREIVPGGWGNPAIFCQLLNDAQSTDYSSTSPMVTLPPSFDDDYQCWFYNIPEEPSTVTIYKWECPQGQPADTSQTWFETNCTTPMNGVTFTLTDSKGPRSQATAGGMVEWTDVSTGAVQIQEEVPAGYSKQPYVTCQLQNAQVIDELPPTINGTWNTTVAHGGMKIVCHWYNWYLGPGEITVYKWTCPEGYDRTAWGADPMKDCTQATNGVTFKLDQPDPGVDLLSNTGDSVNGAVYFGGLMPGNYVLSEMLAPGAMQDVFVWQCYGLNTSAVQVPPLSVGQDFNFPIAGGDKIECHWFNVPYPQHGWMVVTKFNCTTETYVADVYCYTNQTGQEFNLQKWDGANWVTVQSGKTNVSGQVTFNDLEAGDYKLVEPDGKACLMKSSNITPGGNIGVKQGEGTTVYVYNCKTPPPPQTGKTPKGYPNTGVAPAGQDHEQRTPGIELAGLLALAGLHLNRRRVLKGAALLAAGTATALPLARAQELVPIDTTPAPGTPDPAVFGCGTPVAGTPEAGTPAAGSVIEPDGTPGASGTPAIDPCNRGAIPMHIRIPEIEVDAKIEYLEIIDGDMQPPSGATDVTWYKETSRLGEVGNGLFAGHLNFWDVPEGVFFRLESLQEGDVVELDGDDGQTYLYEVQWMQNFPINEDPPDEALGFTDEVAITLITCGGEWDAQAALYDHRTLVRAVMMET